MSTMKPRLSAVRPALLGLAMLLALTAAFSPAAAACAPGAVRTIVVSIVCCQYPQVTVTKQDQVCDSSGVWVNSGSSYCAAHKICAYES